MYLLCQCAQTSFTHILFSVVLCSTLCRKLLFVVLYTLGVLIHITIVLDMFMWSHVLELSLNFFMFELIKYMMNVNFNHSNRSLYWCTILWTNWLGVTGWESWVHDLPYELHLSLHPPTVFLYILGYWNNLWITLTFS